MEPGLALRRFTSMMVRHPPPGGEILEIGANAKSAILIARALPSCTYTGFNLAPDAADQQAGIIRANAHNMPFDDASFDAVVSVSMFEHDPEFWLTLAEVRRVLRPGGHFFVSVPGYAGRISSVAWLARAVRNRLRAARLTRLAALVDTAVAARTYPFHMEPHDYYRFSPQALESVLLAGFDVLVSRALHSPPTLHAAGRLRTPASPDAVPPLVGLA